MILRFHVQDLASIWLALLDLNIQEFWKGSVCIHAVMKPFKVECKASILTSRRFPVATLVVD